MNSRALLCVALVGLALSAAAGPAGAAAPPDQPKTGPGSSVDATTEVVKRATGRASNATYVYHLAAAPAEPRPVVVFLHAWGAVNPLVYGGWIEHLARRGHLVLYPGFQTVGKTRAAEATDAAASLIKATLEELKSDPQARPDTSKIIYLGHSAGAVVGLNLAAGTKGLGLPPAQLVFAVMPGGVAKDEKSRGIPLADLAGIEAGTALVTVVGDREFQAAERLSRRVLKETSAVPVGKKLFVRSASDDHGFPALSATLASPASPKEGYDKAAIKVAPDPPPDPKNRNQPRPRWSADTQLSGEQQVLLGQVQRNGTDALDYLAYWKTFDTVLAAALAGGDIATLRAEPNFTEMGRWTDGWPVRRMSAEMPKPGEAVAAGTPGPPAAPAAAPIQSKQPVIRRQTYRGR